MLLNIRTIVTNTTGRGGKRAKPIRLPLTLGRGSTLPSPGSTLIIPGHIESLAKYTARKGKGRVAENVIRDLIKSGEIEFLHEVMRGSDWVCIEDLLVSTRSYTVRKNRPAVVEPKPEPEAAEPEPEVTEPEVEDIEPEPEAVEPEPEVTEPEVEDIVPEPEPLDPPQQLVDSPAVMDEPQTSLPMDLLGDTGDIDDDQPIIGDL